MTLIYEHDKNSRAAELGWPEGYLQAIYDLYIEEDLSYSQVARLFNVSPYAIKYQIAKVPGFTPKPRGGNQSKKSRMTGKKYPLPEGYPPGTKLKKITCNRCGIVFERPRRSRAVRCTPCQKAHDMEANRIYSRGKTAQQINDSEYNASLADVGAVLNVSRERIRQIQDSALQKIRKWFPELREFIR